MELNVNEEKNESIQLVVFHNSPTTPHIVVAYVDISIGEIVNQKRNTKDDVLTFDNQRFSDTTGTGTIQFEVDVKEDLRRISKRRDAVPKVHIINCHKFRSKEFAWTDARSCAICNSKLWVGRGVKCENCDMVTHRQCCQYVLTKCRNNPIDVTPVNPPRGRLVLSQEHQFPQAPFRVG